MKRRKKYRPKQINADGGLAVFARCHARAEDASPLRTEQLTDIGVAYWLSLEQFRAGDANEEHWSCVVCALNVGMALSENGIGSEYEEAFISALDGAFRAKIRSARFGTFRLDGQAFQAITTALHIHDEQMRIGHKREIADAMRLVKKRIAEGNVYRVEYDIEK